MRILVADDDIAVRKSLSRVLKDAGYDVVLAKDGREVLELFNPRQIDLLILDLGLPFWDGWDAFEKITNEAPTLPIIIITGQTNQYDIALAAGVGALMEKPLDAPLLLETIREVLAEGPDDRLQRMCGHNPDLRHVPSVNAAILRQMRENHSRPAWRQLADPASGR